jgi:hypothetical protein
MLATLCVTLSLGLFVLGGADPVGWFFLGTLSFGRSTTIVGPVSDTVAISHAVVAGAICEESGKLVNIGLLHLL